MRARRSRSRSASRANARCWPGRRSNWVRTVIPSRCEFPIGRLEKENSATWSRPGRWKGNCRRTTTGRNARSGCARRRSACCWFGTSRVRIPLPGEHAPPRRHHRTGDGPPERRPGARRAGRRGLERVPRPAKTCSVRCCRTRGRQSGRTHDGHDAEPGRFRRTAGKGGALVLVAGPRYMPLAFRETPLARLMPIDLGTARAGSQPTDPRRVRRATDGNGTGHARYATGR